MTSWKFGVIGAGWVYNSPSADKAIEIAGKVPGVTRVVSTIGIDE